MQNKFKTIISHLLLRIYSISRPVKLLHIISPKILLKLCKVWTWRDAAWMPHQSFRTAPVVEGCLTKVQVFLGVAHYRSKAKDKGLGILVPPGLTLTGHFSSKAYAISGRTLGPVARSDFSRQADNLFYGKPHEF